MGEREGGTETGGGENLCRHPFSGLSGLPLLILSPDLESLGFSLLPLSGHTLLSSKAPWAASWLGPLSTALSPRTPYRDGPLRPLNLQI